MKLKYVRYFGSFFERENKLGWMPFWKVAIIKIIDPNGVNWLKQTQVRMIKEEK